MTTASRNLRRVCGRYDRWIPSWRMAMYSALALFAAGAPGPAWTQGDQTLVSSDITIDLATPVNDQELSDQNGQPVGVVQPGSSVDLVGFHRNLVTGIDYFAYDIGVVLPDGYHFRQGDAVQHDGTRYTLLTSATILGATFGVEFDALSFDGEFALVSFNVTTEIGGIVVDDEDVVRLGGPVPELLFDGSAEGVPTSLDVDGVHLTVHPVVGRLLLLSFDGHGMIGGNDFADEDVVAFNLDNGTWGPWFSGAQLDNDWKAASVDAVAVITAADQAIFADGFESGNVDSWSSSSP